MKDVFYTILVVWVLWRIFGSRIIINSSAGNAGRKNNPDVKVDPSSSQKGRKLKDDAGEFIDYEEIK